MPGDVILDGNRAIVNATGGDDHIVVAADPATNEYVVTITGPGQTPVVRRFAAGTEIVVRGGGGNDDISITPGWRRSPPAAASG